MNDYSRITMPATSGVPHTVDAPVSSFDVSGLTTYDIGDLRRKWNFGNTFTKLSYRRDPFLHLANSIKGIKKPTDDAKWEYPVKRNIGLYKRYAYVVGLDVDGTVSADYSESDSTTAWNTFLAKNSNQFLLNGTGNAFADIALGQSFSMLMAGDYKTSGNLVNKVGRTVDYALGANGTKPNFFLPGQTLRIPLAAAIKGTSVADYASVKIDSIYNWTYSDSDDDSVWKHGVVLNVHLVRAAITSTNEFPVGCSNDATIFDVSHSTGSSSIAQKLEPARCYVSGSAYHELSGYGSTYRTQPFSTETGLNQIFKVTAMMSNRARATVLKFGGNPWSEEWETKMREMNWDIGQTAYFGDQYTDSDGVTYTEGFINYALNNANSFTLTTGSKTLDDFLEDMSAFNDPRYQYDLGTSIAYFVRTDIWNWLHKLAGFQKNNMDLASGYNIDLARRGKVTGVDYSSFTVMGTTMNVIRDVHLDGTNVKMAAINLKSCAIRPLIGNGINRDVTVYPGVKTIQNSGEDYRVDLIQADIGFMFTNPETHAIWL